MNLFFDILYLFYYYISYYLYVIKTLDVSWILNNCQLKEILAMIFDYWYIYVKYIWYWLFERCFLYPKVTWYCPIDKNHFQFLFESYFGSSHGGDLTSTFPMCTALFSMLLVSSLSHTEFLHISVLLIALKSEVGESQVKGVCDSTKYC